MDSTIKTGILTQARLREILDYDPVSGVFTWNKSRVRNPHAGEVAGSIHRLGYVQICVDGKSHLAHRLAWLYVVGELPMCQIDHIDGDRTNNKWSNLRDASISENHQNRGGAGKANKTTGLLGCHYDKRRGVFRAVIGHNHKSIFLGSFATALAAHAAYRVAKANIHTHHERLLGDKNDR